MNQIEKLVLSIYPRQYRTLVCNSCRRGFIDRELVWQFEILAPSYVYLCGDCAKIVPIVTDFDPLGSKEEPQVNWSWLWIRQIVLKRDNYKCRLDNDDNFKSRQEHWAETEVHHIIPRKDGGTDNFKNLLTLCEPCHRITFKNGYAGLPHRDPTQLILQSMPSEGRFAFPNTPKVRKISS